MNPLTDRNQWPPDRPRPSTEMQIPAATEMQELVSTICEQRDQIALRLERSPSVGRYVDRYINAAYRSAVVRASLETGLPRSAFPATPPFSTREVLDLHRSLTDEVPKYGTFLSVRDLAYRYCRHRMEDL